MLASFTQRLKYTDTDKLVAWVIADDAIKAKLAEIPDRKKEIYPHSIVLYGEFGALTIKE